MRAGKIRMLREKETVESQLRRFQREPLTLSITELEVIHMLFWQRIWLHFTNVMRTRVKSNTGVMD